MNPSRCNSVVMELYGLALVPGEAGGSALVLNQPLSLWGGVNPDTAVIIDQHHPQRGTRMAGRVLLMPSGRGSSSSSAVLVEMVRQRTNPAAILLASADSILILGAIVAREFYSLIVPVVILGKQEFARIKDGDQLIVHYDGRIERAVGYGRGEA